MDSIGLGSLGGGSAAGGGGVVFSIQGSNAESFFHNSGEVAAGAQPQPPASNWAELVAQLSKVERSKFELLSKSQAEKTALQDKLDKMIVERDARERAHAGEITELKQTAEKQVRDAVNKLRRDIYICADKRKKAETHASEAEARREEAMQNVTTLESRMNELLLLHAQKENEAHHEVIRVKGEREASYKRAQDHAEERVKAMSYMAREAQDAMYRNMDVLEMERKRLTVRAQRQNSLGMGPWQDAEPPPDFGDRQGSEKQQRSMSPRAPLNAKTKSFFNPYGAKISQYAEPEAPDYHPECFGKE